MDNNQIVLKYPIPHRNASGGKEEKKILTFGRLKAKHLKNLPKSFFDSGGKNISMDIVIPLIAGICNISIKSADEIDVIEDMPKIVEVMTSFLGTSLATGKK